MPKKSNLQEFITKSRKLHGDKYDYTKSVYVNDSTKVTITCPFHGDYEQRPNGHLQGQGCMACAIKTFGKSRYETAKNAFEEKAKKIHGERYDYSKSVYAGAKTEMEIICKAHNVSFFQKPNNHLNGEGCRECGRQSTTKYHVENPTGWSASNWQKIAEISKTFDSFKVYLLALSNSDEYFYKIGRTYNKIKTRTKGIPYKIEILHEIKHEDSRVIFNLEHHLKREYKSFKYTPKLDFGGKCECFSLDLPIQQIITNYPTNYIPKIDDAPTPTP